MDVYANGQHVFRFQNGVAIAFKNIQAGTARKFTLSSANNSTKNAAFYLWGNPSRPVVAELGDDSGWHFFSQRNPDNSIVFTVNGQVIPLNYGNFDARYKYRTEGVQDVRYG
ncbi:TPA: phage tail protein, partial [Shigella flexneri]|nr:phage tail protein [Shigella flexneri]HAY5257692.1 phage tail protein [Shigella flexneri]HAY5318027.1 phage tail protein [Shigella flexneri]HAY5325883.1 phage tail protein [Shigella flexneri]